MGQVSAEAQLAMTRTDAWAKMQDLMLAKYYVPGVLRIEITTPQQQRVGASRRVFCKGRPPIDETVIAWEDGHGFTVKLHHGDKPPAPFRQAQFIYRLDDAPDGQTRATMSLVYELPYGALGVLMDAVLMRPLGRRTVNAIARGLKQVYETGKSANPLAT